MEGYQPHLSKDAMCKTILVKFEKRQGAQGVICVCDHVILVIS